MVALGDSSAKPKRGRPKGKASNGTGTLALHFETNAGTPDGAAKAQLAEKDRELEELRRQLREAQDRTRAQKHMATQLGFHPLFIMLTADALTAFNRQHLPLASSSAQITPHLLGRK